MKKLLLIRHAKATHDTDYSDFERPLKKSGIKDAEMMALRIKSQSFTPQIIFSSPSLRTKATADIFAEHLSVRKIQSDKAIYEASEEDLLDIINDFPDQYDFIALVGHNPAISQMLYHLTGQIKDVPPCAVAVIDFDFDKWELISRNTGNLVHYDEV
jgi:phosphohistidine phosphatase